MKKVILTLAASLIMSSVVMAAPVTDLQKDQSIVGAMYWNPSLNQGSYSSNPYELSGIYAEIALNNNITIGIDYATAHTGKGSIYYGYYDVATDFNVLDISAKYKLNKNIQLIAGNRNHSNSVTVTDNISGGSASGESSNTNKLFYGAGVTANIGSKSTPSNIYASLLYSDVFTDKQAGINLGLNKTTALNVNYRQYSEDGFTLKGIGAGVAYTF